MNNPSAQAHIDSAKRRLTELENQKKAIDYTSKVLKTFLNDLRAVPMPNQMTEIFRTHTDAIVREFAAFAAKNREDLSRVKTAIDELYVELRSQ